MKSQFKRFSKSALSVVLAFCMLVSCMTVGLIATDAAQDNSESIGVSVSGTPLYYDFTQLTSGGYNYIDSSGDWKYDTDRSQVIAGGWPTDGNTTIAKWEQGGWNGINVKASDVESGKNMLVAHADNTVTWDVYGGSGGGGGGSSDPVQRYIYVGISSHYNTYKNNSQYGFNFWGGTSGGVKSGTYLNTYDWDERTYYMYRVQVYDDNNKAQFKGNDNWYDPSGGFNVTLNGTTNNAVFFSNSNDGWGGQFQQNYQETSTASLSATSTSITTAQTSTLTPSLSTNATYNEIQSTTYSVSTNPGSAGSVTSAGVFSATAAGTYTVTATVTYNPKYFTGITKTATATKNITVTAASNPTCSAVSLSRSPSSGTIYKDATSVTYTASATSPVSGVNYNFKVDGTSVQNTTSNTYTTTFDSTGTKSVTVSVEKSSYDTVTSSADSITVENLPTVYFNWNGDGSDHNPTMTYDATASASKSNHIVYKLDQTWPGNSSRYIKIYDGSDRFKTSGAADITDSKPLSGSGVSTDTTDYGWMILKTNTGIASSETGKYTFYWDFTDKKLYVEYPYKVTFNNNGHGSAPAAQIVNYNAKATKPSTLTATSWTHDGNWYTEPACSNQYNFNTAVTANKTLYAKWTQNEYTISYPSTTTGYTLEESKPTSAHYGDTISFTVTPLANYRIGSVKYKPTGGSETDCTVWDDNEYRFTMPDKNVTVIINMVETRTVTLTASTGFGTKQYKIGNGSYEDYSAPFTVDKGSVVTFKVTYSNGYVFDNVTNATASSSNTIFTTAAINSDTIVTINAKKQTYDLIGAVSPNQGGSVTFYSTYANAVAGTSAISTSQIGNTVYAKFTPSSDCYALNNFSKSGSGLSNLTVQADSNIVKFTMGYSNATITANVVATTPTFTGTWSGMTVYANENFTYSNTGGGVSPTGCTYTYSFNGITDQASSAFTAPDRPGTYTLTIKASNKPAGISNAATATTSVSIKVIYREKTVTYYIDMHNNNMQDKTLDVAIVSNGSGSDESILKDSEGHNCIGDLLQQGNSTVYAASIATPATKVTNSDSYQPINLRIRYGPNNALVTKIVAIDSSYSTPLMDAVSPEVWLEANNEAANTYKVTYANNSTTAVQSGKKRLYVAKPLNWETAETSWTHLHLYHWGDYADIGWNSAPLMTHIGSDSNYHYYYIDVDSGIDNIIFQGWKNNSTSPDVQTENIEKIGSSNFFVLSKDNGKYYGTKSDENETVPGYTRYVSSVDMNVGETANIAPVNTGKKVIYSSNNNNVTVSEDGDVTATGSALATITVKVYGSVGARVTSANPGDVMTYECTVNVHNPGIFKGYRIISFDHQEYNVIIPTISGANPGYFNLDNASVVVNGLYDDATSTYITKYANSAIIEATDTIDVDGVGNDLPIEFTVKYAASNSNTGYSNITLDNATITTVSIKKSGQKRFGFKEWIPSQANITSSKTIDNGVETVVHKGLAFSSGTTTYQATFDEYKYVDVTFTFNYYEYNPELSEDGMVNYPYDETWAGSETFGNTFNKKMFTVTELADGTVKGSWAANVTAEAGTPCVTLDVSAVSSSGGDWYAWTWGEKSNGTWISGSRSGDIITFADNVVDNNIIFVRMNAGAARDWDNAQNKTADLSSRSHNLKTYTVSNYEVRGLTANGEDDKITSDNLVADTVKAIGVMPTNNYYDYGIDSSTINITSRNAGTYSAAVTVNMTQSPQEYKVYLNGTLKPRRNPSDPNDNRTYYYYQEYAEPIVDDPPTANSFYNWYAVDSSASDASTDNAPLLATNVNSYKFRVKGSAKSTNTYLRTAAATNPHGNDFLRSEVDFSHYEVVHRENPQHNVVDYLMQNFYIADFFSPSEVLDPNSYSGKGKFGPAYKVETVNESTSTSSGNITVYFTDSLDWNDIHIYYWGENINNVNWPGSVMIQYRTDEDGKTIYSAEIPGTAEGVIFTGNNNQTVDITNNIANGSHWKSKNEIVRNGIPYDDAQFVGGGVVYYSMNGATENNQGTPFANAVSSGYVNGSDGKINTNAVKEMLKANIEAQYAKDNIAGAVGENEAMKIAYGTEIAATKNVEGGFNTGIIYRYLPLNQYKRDGNGNLLAPDQDGNYAYDVNKNTFRYSNSLQSYQYVYASGNENKETNNGRNMRLYSYYVYSYLTYDQETNVPVTKYEIVLSDNYSDASTYWDGQN